MYLAIFKRELEERKKLDKDKVIIQNMEISCLQNDTKKEKEDKANG